MASSSEITAEMIADLSQHMDGALAQGNMDEFMCLAVQRNQALRRLLERGDNPGLAQQTRETSIARDIQWIDLIRQLLAAKKEEIIDVAFRKQARRSVTKAYDKGRSSGQFITRKG